MRSTECPYSLLINLYGEHLRVATYIVVVLATIIARRRFCNLYRRKVCCVGLGFILFRVLLSQQGLNSIKLAYESLWHTSAKQLACVTAVTFNQLGQFTTAYVT